VSHESVGVALLGVGFVLAAVAIAATGDLSVGTALATSGAALAAAGVVLLVLPVVRHRGSAPPADPPGSSLLRLREGFRSGPLGRQAIIASVVSLEQGANGNSLRRLDPDEERRLVGCDARTFRAWLDERLTRLERET
jgi:hypothetical protein